MLPTHRKYAYNNVFDVQINVRLVSHLVPEFAKLSLPRHIIENNAYIMKRGKRK
jgi:hypothetical protein